MTWSWMFIVFFIWTSKALGIKCFLTPAQQKFFTFFFLVASEFICCCIYCVLPFAIPFHTFTLAQSMLALCELTGTVPVHLTGWCRVKFWKMSWHKNARQYYHSKLLLWNTCSFLRNEWQRKCEQWLYIYAYECIVLHLLHLVLRFALCLAILKCKIYPTGTSGNPFGQRSLAVPGGAPLLRTRLRVEGCKALISL